MYKAPTLLNADFNAPYFHGGRYDTFDQVVAHFDRVFALWLSPENQRDLVAYLTAVGDGQRRYENDRVAADLEEISDFASTLDTAIPAHGKDIIGLAVNTVGPEARELTEAFPSAKDTSVSGGQQERALARMALKELVLELRRVNLAAAADRFDEAAGTAISRVRQRPSTGHPLGQSQF